MHFVLDENVAKSVAMALERKGYEVRSILDYLAEGSPDELVADTAEKLGAVLISHDGDFKQIAPRVPDGQKTRFKKLSRIHLRVVEFNAASRIEFVFDFIEGEFSAARSRRDKRLHIQIGESYIRSER